MENHLAGTSSTEIHCSLSRESGWFYDELSLLALLTWTGVTVNIPPALDWAVIASCHRGTVMTSLPYLIKTDVSACSYIHYALRRWVAIKQKPRADTWCTRRPRVLTPARWKSKVQILLFALDVETTVKPCLGGSRERDSDWLENSCCSENKVKDFLWKKTRRMCPGSTTIENESVCRSQGPYWNMMWPLKPKFNLQ